MVWTNRIAQELSSVLPLAMADCSPALHQPPRPVLDRLSVPPPSLPVGEGDRVRISTGVFCGIEGMVVARRGTDRIIIAVDMCEQGITIELDVNMVQSLEVRRSLRFGR